ncbi:MAG: hypothetical protein ACRDSH_03195, partial [Pseudonocardiaceae bacterium]
TDIVSALNTRSGVPPCCGFPQPLPPVNVVCGNTRASFMGVVYFHNDWTPKLITLPLLYQRALEEALKEDLEPVFAQLQALENGAS